MVAYGGLWWLMVVYGGLWWLMVAYGGLWWFMVVYGGLWWFMVVYGGLWCLWWLMVAYGGSVASARIGSCPCVGAWLAPGFSGLQASAFPWPRETMGLFSRKSPLV
jgi:hypothetical protein